MESSKKNLSITENKISPRTKETNRETISKKKGKITTLKTITTDDAKILSNIRTKIKERRGLFKKMAEGREKDFMISKPCDSRSVVPPATRITSALLDKMSHVLDAEIDSDSSELNCTDGDLEVKLETADRKLKKEKEKNRMLRDKLTRLTEPKESFKTLKNMGLEQISSAVEYTNIPYEEIQKRTRMQYEQIKLITSNLEDEFDELIKEKLSGAFRATVKKEILKYLQSQDFVTNEAPPEKVLNLPVPVSEIKEEPMDCVDEVKTPGTKISNGKKKSDSFLDDLSSLSSVHTSDLSSFEDEISISSEDGNEKRKVSLQFAAEEIERVRQNKFSNHGKVKGLKSENGHLKPGCSSSISSPQRVRKPNAKYFSNDVVLYGFDHDVSASATNSQNTPNDGIRKRGRPKKYV